MQLGLIGYPISHSKSPEIFQRFFTELQLLPTPQSSANIQWDYKLFPLESINDLINFLSQNSHIIGFNVTIPHKLNIIPFIEFISVEASKIQSINTVCVIPKNLNTTFENSLKKLNINCNFNPSFQGNFATDLTKSLKSNEIDTLWPSSTLSNATNNFFHNFSLWGFNSDYYGITASIDALCPSKPDSAIILGDGGSAKTVKFALEKLGIPYKTFNRTSKNPETQHWDNLTQFEPNTLYINTTPLGMWPNVSEFPPLPFHRIQANSKLLDLIYNPEKTQAMQEFEKLSLSTLNGKLMLQKQAEKSWEIFQIAGETISKSRQWLLSVFAESVSYIFENWNKYIFIIQNSFNFLSVIVDSIEPK